jgi:hypothetical protein
MRRRAHRRVATVALLSLLVAGCGAAPDTESVAPSTSVPSVALETPGSSEPQATPADPTGRRSDLAFLLERLEAVHPNPFLDEGVDAFLGRIAAIETRVDTMTDTEFLVAVMDLMGHRDRDGHSGAWALAQPGALLHAWPVWFWDFPDGLRVVAATEPDRDLIGARLVRVGDTDVEIAWSAVEPLVPRDNPSNLRANLPMHLLVPEILDVLGLRSPGDPGLTFELTDGSTRELVTDPLPMPAFFAWVTGAYGTEFPTGLPPDDDGPPHLRRRTEAFWSETLSDPAGFYAAYNRVLRVDTSGLRIGQFAADIRRAAAAQPDLPVAIDLRNNPGGDNNTFSDVRRAVEAVAHERPGRVAIIAGRSTFSAAGNFVTDLLVGPERAGIRLVGEAPGGGLNIYGDVDVVTLPTSGIVVLISNRYHERAPGDDRLALTPDVPVEVTWDDYAAGRDPVLEAAFGD